MPLRDGLREAPQIGCADTPRGADVSRGLVRGIEGPWDIPEKVWVNTAPADGSAPECLRYFTKCEMANVPPPTSVCWDHNVGVVGPNHTEHRDETKVGGD